MSRQRLLRRTLADNGAFYQTGTTEPRARHTAIGRSPFPAGSKRVTDPDHDRNRPGIRHVRDG
ncbi:MAG: hypothetical protein M1297_03125, partial [Nitrospirae bacterium]|nr:hypothetical protein [Nitrospirota bacterium]